MLFCTNCGSSMLDDAKFCEQCGTPNENYKNNANEQINEQSKAQEINQVEQQAHAQELQEETNKSNKNNKKKGAFISIICAIIVLAIVATAGTIYYITQVQPNSGMVTVPAIKDTNAQAAATNLRSKGFKVEIVRELNKRKKGSFISLKGIKPGSKVKNSTKITVVESLGPGMPKNVIGKTVNEITDEVKEMGIKVQVHKVVATSKPGTVVATYPTPGHAFVPAYEGDNMHIAVATPIDSKDYGKVVPADILGKDMNTAKNMLKKAGITNYKLKPRFSSKDFVGKITGSYPDLGDLYAMNTGDITVYYGVDASKTKEVLTKKEHLDGIDNADVRLTKGLAPIAGIWCKKGGDCLYFNEAPSFVEGESTVVLGTRIGDLMHDGTQPMLMSDENYLGMNNYSQDISGLILYDKKLPMNDMMKNHLLSGDTGAVEFYKGLDLPSCGNDIFSPSPGVRVCEHGKDINAENSPEKFDDQGMYKGSNKDANTGLTYKMHDFFVLVPVNTKFDELEKSGYFKGKGKNKPDFSRPFIMRRDPKLYDKTQVAIPDGVTGPDYPTSPFVPTKKNKPVPFAPAPDDSNVYYKVEEPINWSLLDIIKTFN
ncbi:PASTA domain-containing protein [Gardnerella swidsinskii]|uniref:PASTA domain-containing protein n=1 Tax=Gardnerella swidsinskii TaxID=2792979 RepID=UPI0036F48AD9